MESGLLFCDIKYNEEVYTAKQEITGFSHFILQKKLNKKETKLMFLTTAVTPGKA